MSTVTCGPAFFSPRPASMAENQPSSLAARAQFDVSAPAESAAAITNAVPRRPKATENLACFRNADSRDMGRIDKMGSNKWKHSLSLVLRLDALSVHAEPNGAKQRYFISPLK